mmetsp:Transcript_69028/g.213462  ORF Transcript_69028/g.213462 Transcript_69028/m.213462 type:complete len:321 (+) Transcript_69028:64-1026(+)
MPPATVRGEELIRIEPWARLSSDGHPPAHLCVNGASTLHQLRQAHSHPVGVVLGALGARGAGAPGARGGGEATDAQVRRALRPPGLLAAALRGAQGAQAVGAVLVRAGPEAAGVRRPESAASAPRRHRGHPRHGDVDRLLRGLLVCLLGLWIVEQPEDVAVGPTDVLRGPRHPGQQLLLLPVAQLVRRRCRRPLLGKVVPHVLVLGLDGGLATTPLRLRMRSSLGGAFGLARTGARGCASSALLRGILLGAAGPRRGAAPVGLRGAAGRVGLRRARGRGGGGPRRGLCRTAGGGRLVSGGHAGGAEHALLPAGVPVEGRA